MCVTAEESILSDPMAMPQKEGEQPIASNRKAFFNYEILDRLEAGIVLRGTEVKSIRSTGLNFVDAYVLHKNDEMFLIGARINPYSHGNLANHDTERTRKLLLKRREIRKIGGKAAERGLTIVPLRAYFKNGKVKVEIGLARGKKSHDKRAAIKKRDIDRDTAQAVRERRR